MTVKVASPACPGLGTQRSAKSQALASHPGPIVLHSKSPPSRQGRCCLSLTALRSLFELQKRLPSVEAALGLSTHPTLLSNPGWTQSRHIRPRSTAPKQAVAAAVAPDSLSYYLPLL